MATFASDSFTGTEDTELSAYDASWIKVTGNTGNAEIASNRARASGTTFTSYYYNATPPSADYPVQATIHAVTSVTNATAGVLGRVSSSANTFYQANANASSGWQLFKRVAGTATQLGSSVAQTYTAGQSYDVKLSMSGTTIELYKLGESTAAISVTDSAISAAGFAGLRFSSPTVPSDTSNFHLDDWSAGEASAGTTLAPTKGSLAVSGKTPTIAQSITVAPSVGHVTATGYAPTVSQSITAAPTAGRITATGYTPTLDQPQTIAPAAGRVTATGYSPTVDQGAGQSLTPTTGHVAASGYAPSVTQSITVSPAAGRVTATGKQPTVSQDASVSVFPATGHVSASGRQPTIEQPLTAAPTTAHALLTGNQPIVVQGASISPQTGHVSASSYAPTISQARTITVTAGQARITGRIPTISQGIEIYSALRTLAIGAEVRVLSVNAENRIMALTAENRGLAG